MKIRLGAVVLDCKDANVLAGFYAKLLDWTTVRIDDDWIFVHSKDGRGIPIVFQQDPDYLPPVWPSEQDKQQQMAHLDFYVDDVEQGVQRALDCGAVPAPVQYDSSYRVMIDPAGHPFCVLPDQAPEY